MQVIAYHTQDAAASNNGRVNQHRSSVKNSDFRKVCKKSFLINTKRSQHEQHFRSSCLTERGGVRDLIPRLVIEVSRRKEFLLALINRVIYTLCLLD